MQLQDWNASELAGRAAETLPHAHRDLPRDQLEAIVRGEVRPATLDVPQRKIDKFRLKIMEYVLDNWIFVSPLLGCPARTQKPDACFACTDVQVAECVLTNPQVLDHQYLGLSQREAEKTMSEAPFTFRNSDEWLAMAKDEKGPGKKEVIAALKAAGHTPAQYLGQHWGPEKRVESIIEFQKKNGWGGGGKAAKTPAKTEKAATTTKTPAKETATEAAPAASGAKQGSALILEKLEALDAKLDALAETVKDGHYGIRLLVLNAGLLDDSADESLVSEHYGKPMAGDTAPAADAEETEEEGND